MQKLKLNSPIINEVEATKKISLALNIRRLSTDANGTIILDSALPDSMQVAYPFHLFGQFDRESGYRIADRTLRLNNNTNLFSIYVWGVNSPLFFFNPLADINKEFQKGDLLFVYVDDLIGPSFFSFVIVNCQDGNYASICAQTSVTQLDKNNWGAFKIFEIHEGWSVNDVNDTQLDELWYFINTKIDSRFQSDNKSPYDFFKPEINKQNKVIIPYQAVINQFIGLSSLISFNNPLLTVSFILYV